MSPITTVEKSNHGSVAKGFARHVKANVVNPVVHLAVNDVVNVSHETLAKRTKKGGRRCGIFRYFSMFFNGKPFSW
jgi:hypothetical protein